MIVTHSPRQRRVYVAVRYVYVPHSIAATSVYKGIEPFPMPKNTRFTEANDVFRNEIDLIWEGEIPWNEPAPVIEEKVQAVLDLELPS